MYILYCLFSRHFSGAVGRDQSPRRMAAQTGGHTDDTYLFCNVPEHHDLVSLPQYIYVDGENVF